MPRSTTPTELEKRFSSGDMTCTQELFSSVRKGLVSMAVDRGSSFDKAEELVQEAFVKILRTNRYDCNRCNFLTFMNMIVCQREIDLYRMQQRRIQAGTLKHDPCYTMNVQERLTVKREALFKNVPEIQASVLEMLYLRGLTISQTARVLGIPTGTVKSCMHRAKFLVRANLARLGINSPEAALA